MPSDHIVASFDQDLGTLRRLIVQMGALAADQTVDCVAAMSTRDAAAAMALIERDGEIDRLESEIEAAAFRLLALRQPVARDLREIVAAIKIAGHLERIGDFAANIAKRAIALAQLPSSAPFRSLMGIATLAADMVRDVAAAYEARDAARAHAVRARDAEVDALYTSLFRELLTYMMESPQQITACTHMLFVAKNIERIGDHATNVAEQVSFLVEGREPEAPRQKGDQSSSAVVDPT